MNFLLADDRLRDISRQFKDSVRNDEYTILLLGFLLVLLIAWAAYRQFQPIIQRRKEIDRLFKRLCSTHDLTERQVELLRNVASNQDIDNPCRLFVHPSLLIHGRRDNREVMGVARKIYGSDITSTTPAKE